MVRLVFSILAAVAGSSLIAGVVSPSGAGGPPGMIAFMTTVGAHGLAAIDLAWSGRRVGATVGAVGLPDWVEAQAEKNRRKATLYLWPGVAMSGLVIWSQAGGPVEGSWHQGLLAGNLAFQVGAFVGEYAVLVAQARLVGDVEEWAEKPLAVPVDGHP